MKSIFILLTILLFPVLALAHAGESHSSDTSTIPNQMGMNQYHGLGMGFGAWMGMPFLSIFFFILIIIFLITFLNEKK